jgi:hypothetical protein
VEPEALIGDYLRRLEAAAWPLPADRKAELAGEVREHIDAALGEAGRRDEATLRNVLDRLGQPEEIVAAEVSGGLPSVPAGTGPGAAMAQPGVGAIEIIAILLLTLGGFVLPIIGPVIGLAFVWLSPMWSTRVKLVVSAIVIGVLVLPIIGLMSVGGGSDTTSGQL